MGRIGSGYLYLRRKSLLMTAKDNDGNEHERFIGKTALCSQRGKERGRGRERKKVPSRLAGHTTVINTSTSSSLSLSLPFLDFLIPCFCFFLLLENLKLEMNPTVSMNLQREREREREEEKNGEGIEGAKSPIKLWKKKPKEEKRIERFFSYDRNNE